MAAMPKRSCAAFAIKADIADASAKSFAFTAQKTMYAGKTIAAGDKIFMFASETQGGRGLFARGTVTAAAPVPPRPGVDRQTPRVSITVADVAAAKQPLGRGALKQFSNWQDGQPQTELNFKFYRQATNKIVGITDATADFLDSHF
jgi:hypothetical protein